MRIAPRQLRNRLEVRADHLRLHRLLADARQPRPLAIDFFARLVRERQCIELGLELLQSLVVGFTALAKLLLDRLQLLAQVDLALAIAELLFDLLLNVLLDREQLDLALDMDQHAAQPVLDGEHLEQRLAFRDGNVEVAGDQVDEPTRILDVRQHLLDGLFGHAALLG